MKLLSKIYTSKILSDQPFTPVYGLARAFLAIGTLITLLFNDIEHLFEEKVFDKIATMDIVWYDVNLYYLLGYDNLVIAKIISIFVLLWVISGFFPFITGLLHWWVAFSYNSLAFIVDGGDQVTAVITFLLIPVTVLDTRSCHWLQPKFNISSNTRLFGNLIFLVISLQMSIIYLQAAIEKLYKLDEWVQGTAIYYYLNDPLFGAGSHLSNLIAPVLSSRFVFILSWSVIVMELLLFAAIFMSKKNRLALFYLGICFHLLIIIAFGLVSFFFAMAAGLIIYLIPKDMPILRLVRATNLRD